LIGDQIRGSAVWVEKEDFLASVPGVGKTIARTLIAELPELVSLDRRQIAALVGLALDPPVRAMTLDTTLPRHQKCGPEVAARS
jgi:hypothetical protein